jgi:3',5'-cyclic AMP phosphodiesterase CpdA
MTPPPTVRLAHFSDIHLTPPHLGWHRRDWLSKRVLGWINLRVLGRGYRFRHSHTITACLQADLRRLHPDQVIFSGDATTLGFENEFKQAAERLAVTDPSMPPGLAVPGNHDYYTRRGVEKQLFETYFAPWLEGIRVDEAPYPFARRVGPVWLIGLNSSTYNQFSWDATGRVGPAQLDRLARLLQRLEPGPRIIVSHYPLCVVTGKPEPVWHRLRDWRAVTRVAADHGVCLWLNGHRHHAYHWPGGANVPFPLICAGSATQSKRWGYNEYAITGTTLVATRRVFNPAEQAFAHAETFTLELKI